MYLRGGERQANRQNASNSPAGCSAVRAYKPISHNDLAKPCNASMILASYIGIMLARLQAQFHEVRLELRVRQLRRRERSTLRRLGAEVATAGAAAGAAGDGLAPLLTEIAEGEGRAAALLAQERSSLELDRADLRQVAGWVKPLVLVRGLCTRLVLRHRRSGERRALRPRLETLGERVTELPGCTAAGGSLVREMVSLREQLSVATEERKRWGAPYGGSAIPPWAPHTARELRTFGRAVLMQLRSHLLPKAPAIAGLCVGWWIANTYTDSHLRSALRSLGIGSGGTRVVSSSTYEAMSFWLPLLAAALCAYLGERIGGSYGAARQQMEHRDIKPRGH
jgi:hypothetical protein